MSKDPKADHAYSAVLDAPRIVSTGAFFSSVRTRETEKGTHVIEGIRIFKAGTFADSMGIVRTWEESHLEQMVFHYRLLREANTFPNVPVRVDHSFSAESVIGYFVDIYRDADDPTYLAADIEITEPEAYEKWERGTYRSRSLEVGMYETNEEAAYWPVVMGLAFVDIPAVEGLHAKGLPVPPSSPKDDNGRTTFSFSQTLRDDNKENSTVDHEAFAKACAYATALDDWSRASSYAQAAEDWISAASYAQSLEAHQAQGVALGLTPADHGAPQPVNQISFTRNGQQVVMSAQEVGTQLSALEEFRRETIDSGRREFVDGLAKDGKIAVTQCESMHSLVATMNDDQFTAFQSSYEAAPAASLFGSFGNPAESTPPAGGETQVDEIATLEEIVANHRRAGKSTEQIEAMASFKKLQTLKSAQGK